MKKALLTFLLLTVFSLPVFAKFETDQDGNLIVESVTRELLEEMFESDDIMTEEERKVFFDRIYEDGVMIKEEYQGLLDERDKMEDAFALKNGCITRDEARVYAKEYMLEQYEGNRSLYDAESLLGASGKVYSRYNTTGTQGWSFLLQGATLYVSVSCDGRKVRSFQGSNR